MILLLFLLFYLLVIVIVKVELLWFVMCQNHCSPQIAVANCEQGSFYFVYVLNKLEFEFFLKFLL